MVATPLSEPKSSGTSRGDKKESKEQNNISEKSAAQPVGK
jgi:hypothetical protein